jgi:excisionase family DNA binding protein
VEKLLLKVEEVAELTSLGRSKIYELVASGELRSVSIGRARRIPVAALAAWVDGAPTDGSDEASFAAGPAELASA